jgi:hypothetical protein
MPERSKGFAGSCFCFSLTCIRYREASDRFQPNLLQSKMGSDPKILLSLFPPGTASASAGISVLSDSCNVGSATIESTGSTVSCVPGEHACILRYAGHERHQQAAVAARRVDEWTRLDELLVPASSDWMRHFVGGDVANEPKPFFRSTRTSRAVHKRRRTPSSNPRGNVFQSDAPHMTPTVHVVCE